MLSFSRTEAEGLLERELARRLGLDSGTVTVWERGTMRRPYSRIWWVFDHYLASVSTGSTAIQEVRDGRAVWLSELLKRDQRDHVDAALPGRLQMRVSA